MVHTHENIPAVITKAEGITLVDAHGNEFLDFLAGTTCVNIGYGNREVIEFIEKQLEATAGLIGLALNPSSAKLMRVLAEIAPKGLSKSLMISGGSEANEMALKIARRCTKKFKIVTRWGGYHGNTAAALSASGVLNYKMDFDPLLPGFIHVPPPREDVLGQRWWKLYS
ncbi:MAG: aminotransferase class III-fold pyridoxal phosphate-dependent enzyme [Candidatus Jordarchaeum sp.]|uniref:aminotransferase class III-fold pyridoxal phosphate-dependent enzyme n=1 Tax=Candidatus Jordarchaeum sp. TaxID=2823881 RepID=UPI0040491292